MRFSVAVSTRNRADEKNAAQEAVVGSSINQSSNSRENLALITLSQSKTLPYWSLYSYMQVSNEGIVNKFLPVSS